MLLVLQAQSTKHRAGAAARDQRSGLEQPAPRVLLLGSFPFPPGGHGHGSARRMALRQLFACTINCSD